MAPLYNTTYACAPSFNDVFYLNFLQEFALSLALSLKDTNDYKTQQAHPPKDPIPF